MSQFIFPPLTASLDSEATSGAALPTTQMIIGGYHAGGSKVYPLAVDADGQLQVDIVSTTGPSNYATDTLQTAGNAILTTIDTDTGNIAAAVSGTEMQVDVVAALPAGTNEIGKLAAGTASIGTVVLGAGTAEIGKLAAGTASIGVLGANSGVDIGDVTLNAGTAEIGKLAAGTASIGSVTLNANSGVDVGDVDVTSVIPGVGATNLGKAIQSAQGVTDTGVPALVVRNDTLADLSGADGDYAPVQVNATGAIYTVLSAGTAEIGKLAAGTASIGVLGANSGVDIGDVTLNAGTAEIGKLAAGTAAIGSVTIGTSTGVDIGNVGLLAGTNEIGKLAAGTAIIGKILPNTPVDFLDAGVFDASTGTNIPAAGSAVLVTLAADCKEIEVVDDIGEYMSLRLTDGTVKAYLPLGGGRVMCSLSTGNAMKLYSETGTTISSGKIAMNFLG